MTEVTPEKKSAVLKLLAIFGFITIVALCVLLAVQIVNYAPTAFQSLASLADSVETIRSAERATLDITAERSVVQSGSRVTLQWNDISDTEYTFTYNCTDGVAIEQYQNGETAFIACDTPFMLGSATTLTLEVASERNRFTDITYTISAHSSDTDESLTNETRELTVMNVAIPVATSTPESTVDNDGSDTTAEEEVPETEVDTDTPTEPSTPTPQPTGTADLDVAFRAVGILDQDGIFQPRSTVDNDDPIAVQFWVRNFGTATSDVFTFIASLDGTRILSSGSEQVLQPGQEATLTIEFTTDEEGRTPLAVDILSTDRNTSNNSFTKLITITD